MKKTMLMTPGPTEVHRQVRRALSARAGNPDLDPDFFRFYKETADRFKELFDTRSQVLILDGEGLLGLEAACATLIEPGDRVLCIDNGLYGRGFGDFVRMYGGEPVFFEGDYREAIDPDALADYLRKDSGFKAATLVHCETPSGIRNPVDRIGPLLKQYGILSIVDTVSAVGGEEFHGDDWGLDVVLAGSQKCLSAPPGLSIVSVSDAAWEKVDARRVPIASFYCSLQAFRNWEQDELFPYTQPISDIAALRVAVERLLGDGDAIRRHRRIASAVRRSIEAAGLELYPRSGCANTVTAVVMPSEMGYQDLFDGMLSEHGIMIAGNYGALEGKVFRIGHMGENCRERKVFRTLRALDRVLRKGGVSLGASLHREFRKALRAVNTGSKSSSKKQQQGIFEQTVDNSR